MCEEWKGARAMMEVVAAMGAPAGVRGSATPSTVLFFPLGKGDIARVLPPYHLNSSLPQFRLQFIGCVRGPVVVGKETGAS